jgi:phage terminase large subunit
MFKTGPLYLANLNSTASVVVNQGGTSSGKTYSIEQALASIAIKESNRVITVAGQDIPNLKVGAIRDMENIIQGSPELQSLLLKPFNKTERTFYFKSGSIIEYKSYDDAQDAKSGKRDYLFMNEANGMSFDIYSELHLRTRIRTYLDYNPNSTFWVHEKVIGNDGVELIISDHRHNPFLEQSQRDKIEALKDIDLDLWKVYARGMTGKIEGLVFRNWRLCDEIPQGATFVGYGMDFGFTNDPTTFIEVYKQDGELWINELIYQTGLTNQDINLRLRDLSIQKNRSIVADSAEPKSIEELRRMGWTIEGANKGADSINISISMLKNYRLNITKHSTNLRKELSNYKWKVDKSTGNPINQPVDYFNHCIDAVRYVALNKLLAPSGRTRTGLI